jgi:hypothetical protein
MNFSTVNLMRVACCITWAGLIVSMAAPANAYALKDPFNGTGNYASCSATSSVYSSTCGTYTFNYRQNMRFISTTCSSGACSQTGMTDVDSIYATGRKTVTVIGACFSANVVGLGSCSC